MVGAPYCLHTSDVGQAGFDWMPLEDGRILDAGNVAVEVLHTPGHTPDSICLLVTDKRRGEAPWFVVTGDTLFVGAAGRPDLLGREREMAAPTAAGICGSGSLAGTFFAPRSNLGRADALGVEIPKEGRLMARVVIGLAGDAKAEKSLCAERLRREWGATRVHLRPSVSHDPSRRVWRRAIESAEFAPAVDGSTVLVVVDDVETADDVAVVRRMDGLIVEIDDAGPDDGPDDGTAPDLHVRADASGAAMLAEIDDIAANVLD